MCCSPKTPGDYQPKPAPEWPFADATNHRAEPADGRSSRSESWRGFRWLSERPAGQAWRFSSRPVRAWSWLALSTLAAISAGAATNQPLVLETPGPSVVFSLFRVVGALALVFALLFGGVWLFRNWQRLAVQRGRPPRLKVLEVKSLGPRHALYVVGYDQQRFLVSSAPAGIALLSTLPPATTAEPEPLAPGLPSFAETLVKALNPRSLPTGTPR